MMRSYGGSLMAGCLLAFALTACGSGDGTNGKSSASNTASSNAAAGNTNDGKGGADGNTVPGNDAQGDSAAGSDDAGSGGGKKTIAFSTFWQDDKFEEAKKKYEALHPDIEIKLEHADYSDATLESDIEKYVTSTNAAMLAGKGPDLLQLDLLPADNYVKHKLLADMSPMMSGDSGFHKDDYFDNILDNVRTGQSLYEMPLTFFLMGFAGDADAIAKSGAKFDDLNWSWSDFTKTAGEMVANGPLPSALSYLGPEYLLGEMVSDNYSLFMDAEARKAHFDSASFTGLMKQVKTLFDDGVVSKMGRGVNAYFQSVQINSPKDYLESMQGISLGVKLTHKELGNHMKLYAKPHAQDNAAGGYFQTYRSVAIGANSKVKPEAWDFVEFLMSEEIQSPSNATGFPINKAAFAKQIQDMKALGSFKSIPEGPLQGKDVKVDDAMLDGLNAYVNGAVHPVAATKSDKVWEIVVEEAKAFYAGQKSAEDVANLVQNKVTTYLNE
ncbi:carbohydrate ABC transporter substrate-binding protein [Paenibacillus rhizovicinus]|uniref:Carbohydrate ABC transporter substrate-binding protein n=1 Tax=Paenibacillus rhizovicinus TaxID=2704463 RepID=A0A6C0NTM1_9BACL|nr:ABC transporter substrate-binding protein [Paenibacillus rhizovicinus]QHW29554.1 carbohydrate ABC transporter substrate-binding protein [Paenibacillus rhizovicinus]